MGSSAPPATPAARVLPLLQALADEKRLAIVDLLRRGEHCVCELQDRLGVSQSLLSHHLRVLREAGVVSDRKDGRWVHYRLAPSVLEVVEGFLTALRVEALGAAPAHARRD